MSELGTLTFRRERWWVKCKAHVMVRLKRLFAQLDNAYKEEVSLSDTPDVAKDLEWFMARYPLKMTAGDRKHLAERVKHYETREELTLDFMRGKLAPRRFELAEPPRSYQTDCAEFAIRQRRLLIGDDMGVGKTVTGICILTDPDTRPAVIVMRRTLQRQWEAQLKRFAPTLKVHRLLTGKAKYSIAENGVLPDVIITTYTKLPGWVQTFIGNVRTVIFDEAQELCHGPKTQKGKAAKALSEACVYAYELTGTPINNLGAEFYYVLDVILPDRLGTRHEFLVEHCGDVDSRDRAKLKDPRAFGEYIRRTGMMVRRTRKDVGRELPPFQKIAHTIDSDPEVLREIEGAAMRLARIIVEGTGKSTEQFLARQELSAMVRKATGIAKAPFVAEFVNLLLESENKVVLYGWHYDVYAIWKERLEKEGHKVAFITGEQSEKQQTEAFTAFVEGEARVLVMSNRMSAGLDGLQKVCRTCIFGELDYSPMVHEQCITRVFRDGQEDSVAAYFLLAEDGSDPIVADILQIKREQIDGVRNPTMDIVDQLENDGVSIRKLAEQYLRKQRRSA